MAPPKNRRRMARPMAAPAAAAPPFPNATNPAEPMLPSQQAAPPPRASRDFGPDGVRIRRRRRDWAPGDAEARKAIADRVLDFYDRDSQARSEEADRRMQRHAKLRLWTTGKEIPWPGSSDAALPDILTHSLRVQDTLHNAVMSAQPPITSQANFKTDQEKQEKVDRVIGHQVFNDQPGEELIGELIRLFIDEGAFTVFIPWVEERRKVSDVRIFPPLPATAEPAAMFQAYVGQAYPKALAIEPANAEGWDWKVTLRNDAQEGPMTRRIDVGFYTRESGEIEMVAEDDPLIFDGPVLVWKDWSEVLMPPRAENVQRPGPSNPRGASHVILVDRPTISEIADLQRRGYYDLITADDVKKLQQGERDITKEAAQRQKDALKGVVDLPGAPKGADSHKTVTRLMVFDMYDVDGDGIDEDVVWTVLVEPRLLVRARVQSEMFPASPPMRPLVRREFLPGGMSLPEMLEGLHDISKQMLDQTVDFGTLATMPFGFYRPVGGMKPETMRMFPGELYPLNNPAQDVAFPQIQNNAVGFGINMMTLLNQLEERVAMQGELQFGRVPAGKASALRTQAGMQMVLQQGEARPERILRRFFGGLTEIWSIIHQYNERYLKPGKTVKIVGVAQKGQDIYTEIKKRDEIAGSFQFKFLANVFNTSRQALQQSLQTLIMAYLTPLALQLGIIDPNGAYRLMRDFGKAFGQDPDQYLKPPSADAFKPRILAEDVINAIMQGTEPYGVPLEPGGWQEHIQKLVEFQASDHFGLLTPPQVDMFKTYVMNAVRQAQMDAQRQALLSAAAQFQGGGGGGQGGPPAGPPDPNAQQQPMVSGGNEMLDESMPGAGGGANRGAMA